MREHKPRIHIRQQGGLYCGRDPDLVEIAFAPWDVKHVKDPDQVCKPCLAARSRAERVKA